MREQKTDVVYQCTVVSSWATFVTSSIILVIAVVVPMFNAFSVIALEVYRGGKLNFWKIAKSVASNPLILSSLLGIVLLALGVKLPEVIDKPLSDLADVATPLALVILGAEFSFRQVKSCLRQLVLGVTGRLIVMPLIFLTIAILLGFRGEELIALMVMRNAELLRPRGQRLPQQYVDKQHHQHHRHDGPADGGRQRAGRGPCGVRVPVRGPDHVPVDLCAQEPDADLRASRRAACAHVKHTSLLGGST